MYVRFVMYNKQPNDEIVRLIKKMEFFRYAATQEEAILCLAVYRLGMSNDQLNSKLVCFSLDFIDCK